MIDVRPDRSPPRTRRPLEAVDCVAHDRWVSARVLGRIQETFGWSDLSVVPLPLPVSLTSRKLAVRAGDRTCIVKFVPRYKSDLDTYEAALGAAGALSRIVPELVRPVAGPDGRIVVTSEAGAFWLSDYLGGRPFRGSPQEALAAAGFLARLHRHARDLPSALPFQSSQEVCSFFTGLVAAAGGTRADARLVDRLMDLVNRTTARPPPEEGAWTLHGDPTIQNFCFGSGGEVVGLCDVDDMARGHPERDVATLILSTCGLRYSGQTSSLAAPAAGFNGPLGRRMLDAYRQGGLELPDARVGEELLLLWVEMMCLGIVRGDFSASDVLDILDDWLATMRQAWPGMEAWIEA